MTATHPGDPGAPFDSDICILHGTSAGHTAGQCSRCDECHHEGIDHAEPSDLETNENAATTCWSQFVCRACIAITPYDVRPRRRGQRSTRWVGRTMDDEATRQD
jgi:hypothetical protein